jgi:hypothetical protein
VAGPTLRRRRRCHSGGGGVTFTDPPPAGAAAGDCACGEEKRRSSSGSRAGEHARPGRMPGCPTASVLAWSRMSDSCPIDKLLEPACCGIGLRATAAGHRSVSSRCCAKAPAWRRPHRLATADHRCRGDGRALNITLIGYAPDFVRVCASERLNSGWAGASRWSSSCEARQIDGRIERAGRPKGPSVNAALPRAPQGPGPTPPSRLATGAVRSR